MTVPPRAPGTPLDGDEAAERAILDQRARALAASAADETVEARPLFEALVFVVGGGTYALESRFVRRVLPLEDFTPLPGGPAGLVGITSVRGVILPVFDLPRTVSRHRKGIRDQKWLIAIGASAAELGLGAEEVRELRPVHAEDVCSVDGGDSSLSGAMTRDGIVLLDGARLLQDPRFFVHGDQ